MKIGHVKLAVPKRSQNHVISFHGQRSERVGDSLIMNVISSGTFNDVLSHVLSELMSSKSIVHLGHWISNPLILFHWTNHWSDFCGWQTVGGWTDHGEQSSDESIQLTIHIGRYLGCIPSMQKYIFSIALQFLDFLPVLQLIQLNLRPLLNAQKDVIANDPIERGGVSVFIVNGIKTVPKCTGIAYKKLSTSLFEWQLVISMIGHLDNWTL